MRIHRDFHNEVAQGPHGMHQAFESSPTILPLEYNLADVTESLNAILLF